MGGVAHKPWRLTETENFLLNKTVSPALFEQAAAMSMKAAKPYRFNAFKTKMGTSAIMMALNNAAGS